MKVYLGQNAVVFTSQIDLHKIVLIFDIHFTEYTLHRIFQRSAKRYEEAVEGRPNGEISYAVTWPIFYLRYLHISWGKTTLLLEFVQIRQNYSLLEETIDILIKYQGLM